MTVTEAREVINKPAFFRQAYIIEALCVLVAELERNA